MDSDTINMLSKDLTSKISSSNEVEMQSTKRESGIELAK
jgi:hypothetical protein